MVIVLLRLQVLLRPSLNNLIAKRTCESTWNYCGWSTCKLCVIRNRIIGHCTITHFPVAYYYYYYYYYSFIHLFISFIFICLIRIKTTLNQAGTLRHENCSALTGVLKTAQLYADICRLIYSINLLLLLFVRCLIVYLMCSVWLMSCVGWYLRAVEGRRRRTLSTAVEREWWWLQHESLPLCVISTGSFSHRPYSVHIT